jgi:hypothetical protein
MGVGRGAKASIRGKVRLVVIHPLAKQARMGVEGEYPQRG